MNLNCNLKIDMDCIAEYARKLAKEKRPKC